ncbi:MAG: hypothetical protein J6P40_07400 [Oscillospiraceae bacterium]|nr:hypothetical protein [Oscillospiraceae bacterium]
MATYMVEVNSKFMVRIEIEGSACAAEHYFLDNYKGVWGALAFDTKTMKTDCFIGCMMHDELTTVDELGLKLKELEMEDAELERYASRINTYKEEIKKLTNELETLKAEYTEHLTKWGEIRKNLNANRPQ